MRVDDPANIKSWLRNLGYELAYRSDGFCECLISRADERWLGRGGDMAGALSDALGQMFPSHAAQSLVLAGREEAAPIEPAVGGGDLDRLRPQESASLAQVISRPPPAVQSVRQTAAYPTVALDAVKKASKPHGRTAAYPAIRLDQIAQEAWARESAQTQQSIPAIVLDDQPGPAAVTRTEPRYEGTRQHVAIVASAPMEPDEASADVDVLNQLIDSKLGEMALMTPGRQRLGILAWICHGRALQSAADSHPRVVHKVTNLARRLTVQSKLWWPGSVTALQLDATPQSVGRELNLPSGERPYSWLDAAEAAEVALQRMELRDEEDRRDEYGWADAVYLSPCPTNPAMMLTTVVRKLEGIAGTLEQRPPGKAGPAVRRPSAEQGEELRAWAAKARWLRGWTTDFDLWGRLVGRLRWVSSQMDRRDEQLERMLDAAHHPFRSWAHQLGQDPNAKKKKKLKRDLLRSRPMAHLSPDPETISDWLFKALDVLAAERIAELLGPFREYVDTLNADALNGESGRRERRQFRAVQKYMAGGDGASELDADSIVEEVEDLSQTAELPLVADPARDLLEAVLPETRGKRALFVSNRTDPDLERIIREVFEFSNLDWCEGSPRRVQTVAERVAGGTYDIVLGATGFQSHSMDAHIMKACKRASVPYVRVHRGRQLACTMALARELGINVN